LAQLSKEEKSAFLQLIENRGLESKEFKKLSDISKVKVLDSLLQYIDFKFTKEIVNQNGKTFEWKEKVLETRASFPISAIKEAIPLPIKEAPHLGHDTTRTGLFFGHDQRLQNFFDFNYRFAMHDILDPRSGHPTHANLEFFDIHLRYLEEQKKFIIQDWTFIDIMTLNPWNAYQRPISLKANFGIRRKALPICDDCNTFNAEIGAGFSKNLGAGTLFAFAETDSSYSGQIPQVHLELGLGPSVNLLYPVTDSLLTLTEVKHLYYFNAHKELSTYRFEIRKHFQEKVSLNYDFSILGERIQNKIGLFYYF
jgi:hypothetical protein